MDQWFDRAPRERNEMRAEGDPLNFFRRHDEYDGKLTSAVYRATRAAEG
jgi:hypothetical protein